MNQLLILFIAIPLLAFFATLLWQNRSERPIANIVRFTKVFNIVIAISFAVWWMLGGFKPVNYKLATLYETDHFVFAIQFYYDEITAVFSVVGALLFFLVATFSKYYMHRDQGYKRFFNTILLFATAYNFIILSGNFETLFIGWEIKGICSFILISFYRNRYLPVKNAFKAVSYYASVMWRYACDVDVAPPYTPEYHFLTVRRCKKSCGYFSSTWDGDIYRLHDDTTRCNKICTVPFYYLVTKGNGRTYQFFCYFLWID
jgi:hypothetical protein